MTAILAVVVLLVACGAIIETAVKGDGTEPTTHLEALLGANRPATGIRRIATEGVRKQLGASEIWNVIISDGRVEFEIYVAYWRPGNRQRREAYSHIPDGCWLHSGWLCVEGRSQQRYQVDGAPLKPAEWRRFAARAGTQNQEAIYWCLLGERLFPFEYDPVAKKARRLQLAEEASTRQDRKGTLAGFFGESDFLRFWRWKLDVQTSNGQVLERVSEPRYFIRLNSALRMEDLMAVPLFVEEMKRLAGLGLRG